MLSNIILFISTVDFRFHRSQPARSFAYLLVVFCMCEIWQIFSLLVEANNTIFQNTTHVHATFSRRIFVVWNFNYPEKRNKNKNTQNCRVTEKSTVFLYFNRIPLRQKFHWNAVGFWSPRFAKVLEHGIPDNPSNRVNQLSGVYYVAYMFVSTTLPTFSACSVSRVWYMQHSQLTLIHIYVGRWPTRPDMLISNSVTREREREKKIYILSILPFTWPAAQISSTHTLLHRCWLLERDKGSNKNEREKKKHATRICYY